MSVFAAQRLHYTCDMCGRRISSEEFEVRFGLLVHPTCYDESDDS